jgi:hypothetical protein
MFIVGCGEKKTKPKVYHSFTVRNLGKRNLSSGNYTVGLGFSYIYGGYSTIEIRLLIEKGPI